MQENTRVSMMNNSNQRQIFSEVITEFTKVYKTYDLSIFKLLDGNRVPNLKHINRLSHSIGKNGMICNPILVNEKMEVIDGQHRLEAARIQKTFVYFMKINGMNLNHVHTLNLNQKNWSKADYLNGYADMGIDSYVKLRAFCLKNKQFSLNKCVTFCANSDSCNVSLASTSRFAVESIKNNFEEGTWIANDFVLAQEYADKIKIVGTIYEGYHRRTFINSFMRVITHENFDFNEFMHKLRLNPTALKDCVTAIQYTQLVEDIYNYRSRNKVTLKY